jgi:hypothetical protein
VRKHLIPLRISPNRSERIELAAPGLRPRKALYWSLLISVVLHTVIIFYQVELPEREKPIRKPISVKFVQRAPRLSKALELMKRPVVVQRQLTRKITRPKSVIPRTIRTSAVHGGTALASLAKPGEAVERTLAPQRLELGPEIIAGDVENVKELDVTNLGEDLLDVSDMDTGRYRAQVVVNPKDKRDIKGYFHMDLVKYKTSRTDYGGDPDWNTSPRAMANLADYLETNTDVKVDIKHRFTMDSKDLSRLKVPLIFITGHYQLEYNKAEARNLGEYLRAGGFLLVDDSYFLRGGPFDMSARALIKDALGEDAVFEKLPSEHWLYHCFFDFDGPPAGDDIARGPYPGRGVQTIYQYLEAIFLEGRMVVLFSNKSLNNAWNGDWRINPVSRGGPINDSRQMQFGVNILIFALTQPGGFAQQAQVYQ